MSITEELKQIAEEWINKPFLKKYTDIGKDWLAKQKIAYDKKV